MAAGDRLIERAADWLEGQAERARAGGGNGWQARLADELVADAAFLRKLKPSLMAARARGEAPTNQKPADPPPRPRPASPPAEPNAGGGGPNPFVVAAAALAAGILLAKIVDWRSHAHPRG